MVNDCISHEEVHWREVCDKISDMEFCIVCISKSKPNFVFINSIFFNQNINYSMVDYTIRF